MTWRQAFVRSTPFLCIHATFLLGTAWQASALVPSSLEASDFLRLLASHLKELVVLLLVYGLLAKLLGKWSQAASTLALVFLTTLSAMYFVVTVKTRVVYGAYYLLDEFVHFVVLYGPTYLTPLSCASALGALLGLVLVPYGLVVLGRRREWARGTMAILAFVSLLWGTAGWLLPSEDVPEYISRGPLGLLVAATIRDAEYRERSSARLLEIDGLLDASLDSGVDEPPPLLSESAPFEKVILYQLEGVSGRIFDPDSDYAFVLPRLRQWAQHAIQFRHHYTLSTLTFHSYQMINIGGYIRSGSRLETVEAGSSSLVKPLVREGFETAFFSASDLYYRGNARFLEALGYQIVMHFDDFPRSYAHNGKAIDDRALIDSFRIWAKDKKRFFAVINPIGTHHPYWNPAGNFMGDWKGDAELRNYLNALHYQDEILGELIDYVDREHPEALVVIMSDHGIREYFAELERTDPHEEGFVASFEMRFHVPLYFYSRRAFPTKVQSHMSTSHVDLLPTVLDLMGVEVIDRALGGSSLLSKKQRVHFLNTQHNLDVLALLDGRHKYLFERETGKEELYTLSDFGDWKRVEGARRGARVKHYQELVTSWYRYLTE